MSDQQIMQGLRQSRIASAASAVPQQPQVTTPAQSGASMASPAPQGLPNFSPQTMVLLQGSLPSIYGGGAPFGITPMNQGTMGLPWPIAPMLLSSPSPMFNSNAFYNSALSASSPQNSQYAESQRHR